MISLIVDRLKAQATSLSFVDMAEDLDAIFKGTAPQSGSVFVVPFRERAKPNQLATGFRQLVVMQFLVVLVLRRFDDPRGTIKSGQYDAFTGEIKAALAGWEPDEAAEPFELVGGESTPVGNSVTAYVQTWETAMFLEGN